MQNLPQRARAALLSVMAGLGLSAGAAQAQSFTFDVGAHVRGAQTDLAFVGFEMQGPSRFGSDSFGGAFSTAGRINEMGDVWLGVGFAAQASFGSSIYLEGSIMPGLYYDNHTDLGGALQFRSLIGVGYRLGSGSSVMLAVDHLSNLGLRDYDPGVSSVSLRYRIPF